MAFGLKSDFSNVTDAVYSDNSGLSSVKEIRRLDRSIISSPVERRCL